MISSKNAVKLSIQNTMEKIECCIIDATSRGKFSTQTYLRKNIAQFIVQSVKKKGFCVEYNNELEIIHISWSEWKDEKMKDDINGCNNKQNETLKIVNSEYDRLLIEIDRAMEFIRAIMFLIERGYNFKNIKDDAYKYINRTKDVLDNIENILVQIWIIFMSIERRKDEIKWNREKKVI